MCFGFIFLSLSTKPKLFCNIGIEDKDNWHGKPIPKDRVDALLADLQSQIQSPNKSLSPELPQEDVKPADRSAIRLPSPPAYNGLLPFI